MLASSDRKIEIVDVSTGIVEHLVETSAHSDSDSLEGMVHEQHEEHAEQSDPHVWMSPLRAQILADNIAAVYKRLDPGHAQKYQVKLDTLKTDFVLLDSRIRSSLASLGGLVVYIYHPSLTYFCEDYGLLQKAIETGGKSPTPRQIQQFIRDARSDNARIIFVQNQMQAQLVAPIVDATGAAMIFIDPLMKDLPALYMSIVTQLINAYIDV
jgi:zinc transport system substrate-binding protein